MTGGAARRQRCSRARGVSATIAWAPDGRWLLAGWKAADQWVFIRTGSRARPTIERLRAVGNISRQFDPGGSGARGVPRARGMVLPARSGRPK